MENVIIVFEENHGLLGIAKNYGRAINLLVEDDWLDLDCLEYDECSSFLEHGITLEKVKKMSLEEFNELFDGYFHLVLEKVH